ncbi:hypothetical protein B0A50_01944 [Salinomyces thailandicus]|uniref:S-adenosyl-L-methionine-dependent methyltransferase n=1 Tax=Salinomyces thailandicus TaxID=706561 RepID=A0A4U0U947_9PEZI|nr:hypothetical protein B0A50_01944 [Salinomyces thailandica]
MSRLPQAIRPLCPSNGLTRSLRPSLFSRLSTIAQRSYAISAGGAPIASVFSNPTKHQHRERAALDPHQSRQVDYLRDQVATRLCDRLLDINRTFPQALDFGANACNIARILTRSNPDLDSDKPTTDPIATRIGHLTCADTSSAMLHRDADLPFNADIALTRDHLPNPEHLPYPPATFDLAMSSLSLHWINDLPSVLTQINTCLKPDAPFLAAMSGGDTLFELRGSLQLAEQERLGGIGTHISPLADVRDVGNLLSRAGFKLLTVDVDDIIVDYPSIFALMTDLQAMGEANAALRRDPAGLSREVMLATEAIYRELYGEEGEDGGTVLPATFRTIYMIGWKEGGEQPRPLERGTGESNLTDILGGGGRIG